MKMIMTEKYKILAKYIKDLSSETPDLETYLFVKDNVSKYNLNIDITSKVLKEKIIEINTTLKFSDNELNEKKSYFEIVYATVIRVDEDVKDKKDLEKIILCDVQTKIYPDLERSFLDLVHNSGHPDIKLEKKIDFVKLYNERFN
jgi:preprotein translocase subunit SecB